MVKPSVHKLKPAQVKALITKLEAASELTQEDYETLLGIVKTWAHIVERANTNKLSSRDLRRILGILKKKPVKGQSGPDSTSSSSGSSSPPSSSQSNTQASGADHDVVGGGKGTGNSDEDKQTASQQRNRDEHGRRGWDDFENLPITYHEHGDLTVGCLCPECQRGRLYDFHDPAKFVSIRGQAPLVGEKHVASRLQCNLCKAVFTAPLDEALQRDGVSGLRLYSFSAASVVSIQKYFGGLPWYRQQTLQLALGIMVPDASMADLCERVANVIAPVARLLRGLARCAAGFLGDDTGALILGHRTVMREERHSGKLVERTGCHTTCVIAVTAEGHRIAVFQTGIQHTGELMDEILRDRPSDLPVPYFMGDCHACNTVTVCRVNYGACNSHAVRRFRELEESYPEEAGYARSRYKKIFANEAHCKQAELTAEERLAYHREHSKQLLEEIFEHGEQLLETHQIEPNSDIGEAYGYMVNNRVRLSAFSRIAGMPLENNEVERTLRVPGRVRNNSRCFHSTVGSAIADTIWTVGDTALAYNVNLMDYFTAMQRHAADVRANPELWLPWVYQEREAIKDATGPPVTREESLGSAPSATVTH